MEWFHLRDGKILKRWGARDAASQAKQIELKCNKFGGHTPSGKFGGHTP